MVRKFLNPQVSRSDLNRCPRRQGVGRLRDQEPAAHSEVNHKPFKHDELGYVHADVSYLPQM